LSADALLLRVGGIVWADEQMINNGRNLSWEQST